LISNHHVTASVAYSHYNDYDHDDGEYAVKKLVADRDGKICADKSTDHGRPCEVVNVRCRKFYSFTSESCGGKRTLSKYGNTVCCVGYTSRQVEEKNQQRKGNERSATSNGVNEAGEYAHGDDERIFI